MKFKHLFSEDVQKILTEESLTLIEEAINNKVDQAVISALEEQDNLYSEKLASLISILDKDRTNKMKRLVEAVDNNNASKLAKVVKLYQRESLKDAKKFKKMVVESINRYLEEYLDEAVEAQGISQASKNTSAFRILENMRQALGVDVALMNKSIKGAVMDGKHKLDERDKKISELESKLSKITESYSKMEVKALLEEKISKLSGDKKNFVRKALQDKSVKFINENFDYTVRLFDNQEKKTLSVLKEEAIENRQVKPDVVPTKKIIEESLNNVEHADMYVTELSKTWGTK